MNHSKNTNLMQVVMILCVIQATIAATAITAMNIF